MACPNILVLILIISFAKGRETNKPLQKLDSLYEYLFQVLANSLGGLGPQNSMVNVYLQLLSCGILLCQKT